jgi:trans-feruloyl-CoA hydratase/vanillin synthase
MDYVHDPALPGGSTVLVTIAGGVAWVVMNRPDKRNAMNPALNTEMLAVLDALEIEPRAQVIVLTGAGDSFSSGMDLKEYFRETDGADAIAKLRVHRAAAAWQWRTLLHYAKPTIAMVNGWCFGGAFTPLIACDLAIAANEATFGLSEINWGIIPGGNVTRAVAEVLRHRDALYFIMTGKTFDGQRAEKIGLVNESVPRAELHAATAELAQLLMKKSPVALRQAKNAYKHIGGLSWDTAEDYLAAKAEQTRATDPSRGREAGIGQFLDDKSYKPGLSAFKRES